MTNRSVSPCSSSAESDRVEQSAGPAIITPAGGPTTAPIDLDVGVIYTYEQDLMTRLLATLAESLGGLSIRLILVDNGSVEGVNRWTRQFPATAVIRNARPLGYSANLNRILQASRADYVLLLNTDMFFDRSEPCAGKMLEFMRRRPDCGIACCRLYHEDGEHAPSARRFQTIGTILGRRFGLERLLSGEVDRYLYRECDAYRSWQCDWLSGCFMMIRREAMEDVGLFDTRFTKYFEDVDICLRMAIAGWQVMYHGGTYCYHLEQRASRNLFSVDAWRHARSYLRWLRKWGFSPSQHLRAPERHRPSRSPRVHLPQIRLPHSVAKTSVRRRAA